MASCQIDFIREYGKPVNGRRHERTEKIRVYREHDGRPFIVEDEIKEFLHWNLERNGDLGSTVANFILWSKLKMLGILKSPLELAKFGFAAKIGFAICGADNFENDIEYLYEVIFDDSTDVLIRIYTVPKNAQSLADLTYVGSSRWTAKK